MVVQAIGRAMRLPTLYRDAPLEKRFFLFTIKAARFNGPLLKG